MKIASSTEVNIDPTKSNDRIRVADTPILHSDILVVGTASEIRVDWK